MTTEQQPTGARGAPASPEEQHYHQAKADPIATVILNALYEQDARTSGESRG